MFKIPKMGHVSNPDDWPTAIPQHWPTAIFTVEPGDWQIQTCRNHFAWSTIDISLIQQKGIHVWVHIYIYLYMLVNISLVSQTGSDTIEPLILISMNQSLESQDDGARRWMSHLILVPKARFLGGNGTTNEEANLRQHHQCHKDALGKLAWNRAEKMHL